MNLKEKEKERDRVRTGPATSSPSLSLLLSPSPLFLLWIFSACTSSNPLLLSLLSPKLPLIHLSLRQPPRRCGSKRRSAWLETPHRMALPFHSLFNFSRINCAKLFLLATNCQTPKQLPRITAERIGTNPSCPPMETQNITRDKILVLSNLYSIGIPRPSLQFTLIAFQSFLSCLND